MPYISLVLAQKEAASLLSTTYQLKVAEDCVVIPIFLMTNVGNSMILCNGIFSLHLKNLGNHVHIKSDVKTALLNLQCQKFWIHCNNLNLYA